MLSSQKAESGDSEADPDKGSLLEGVVHDITTAFHITDCHAQDAKDVSAAVEIVDLVKDSAADGPILLQTLASNTNGMAILECARAVVTEKSKRAIYLHP